MEAIILAGGLGTRLASVVPNLPKPLARVADRPFLEHLLDYWAGQGLRRAVISIGVGQEAIRHHFGHNYRGVELEYAIEPTQLGTGGGMLYACEKIQGPTFLLLNGDSLFEVNLNELLTFHRGSRAEVTMGLYQLEANSKFGWVLTDTTGRLIECGSSPSARFPRHAYAVNGGVYLFDKTILKDAGHKAGDKFSLEIDLMKLLLHKRHRMYGYLSDGKFIDIGLPEDYQAAQAMF